MFILLPPSATLLTLESTPRAAIWSNAPGDLSVRPVDLWIDITFLYQFSHAKKAAKKADMG